MSEQLKLWFFRDLTDDQRLKLFGLFGLPVDEIGNVHGRQAIALRHIVQKLIKMVGDEAQPAPAEHVMAIELQGVAEQLADNSGFWRSCSGCHNLNEGHPTGEYSAILKCHLGMGCSECGGIGAVWDNVDYSDFGKEEAAPAEQATLTGFATRLFDLHGFMLLETYRDKPAVTVTFPDLKQAQQFHDALVELSTHRPRPRSLLEGSIDG